MNLQSSHKSRAWAVVLFVANLGMIQPGLSAEPQPGASVKGTRGFTEYVVGNLPIVISVPHGGRLRPNDVPDRKEGTFAFDSYTPELAQAVIDELHSLTGKFPHIIYCRMSRRKVDCNRDLPEAAAGNEIAEIVWREFHAFIDDARRTVETSTGRGLYIDLHAHGHKVQQLELGYLHTAEQLAKSDDFLNSNDVSSTGSLRGIAALARRPYSDLLRGPYSLGTLLEQNGFPAAPSQKTPHPKPPYFNGAYNTQRHARDAAPLAGLQIETNYKGVRDTPENRQAFAKALVRVVDLFLEVHAGVDLVPSLRHEVIDRLAGPPSGEGSYGSPPSGEGSYGDGCQCGCREPGLRGWRRVASGIRLCRSRR